MLDELPDGSSGTIRPVAGAVFLRYTVAVDNFVYVEQDDRSTICSFELLSASGDVWEDKANYDPMRDRICRLDSDEITPSQQVVASFEVPEQLVDQAVGLAGPVRCLSGSPASAAAAPGSRRRRRSRSWTCPGRSSHCPAR